MLYYIGDDCVCWSLGSTIDRETNSKILFLYRNLKGSPLFSQLSLRDVVPSYKALAVYFDPASTDPAHLINTIEEFIASKEAKSALEGKTIGKTVVLQVVYDGEDLARIASLHNFTLKQVIEKHTAPAYQVALVGFRPHFPYLIGLDEDLITPRLEDPRTLVPAGSVAIGGAQTGIYPEDSPGGWNIIGRTDTRKLAAIEPGDVVIFKEVNKL